MDTPKITREEAMRRFVASKALKKAAVERLVTLSGRIQRTHRPGSKIYRSMVKFLEFIKV